MIPTLIETERRRRIRLSLAAFTYTFTDGQIMTDTEFDHLSREVDLSITTDNPKMDAYFVKEYSPDTGQWIHNHPELEKLENLLYRVYRIQTRKE